MNIGNVTDLVKNEQIDDEQRKLQDQLDNS